MKKNYSTFSFANCCKAFMAAVMMFATVNLQAQACVGGTQTSPGANVTVSCNSAVAVGTESVLVFNAGATSVNLYSQGGAPIANTGAGIVNFIGKVVKAEAINGGTVTGGITTGGTIVCWGWILLEDKAAPSIACPANLTLACDQAGLLLTPGRTGQFTAATNAFPTTGGLVSGGANGTTNECSKFEQSYVDAGTIAPCTGGTITRTWRLKDVWGNISATCSQTITVSASPAFVAPTFTNFDLQCQNVTAAQKATLLAGGVITGVTLPTISTTCGLSLNFVGSREIAMCTGSYKIIRRYEVINMCPKAGELMVNGPYEQTIQVLDQTSPTASSSYQNYGVATGTYCFYMQGMLMTNQPTQQITALVPLSRPFHTRLISNVVTNGVAATATTLASEALITLTPRADANMCDAAGILFTVTGADLDCSAGNVTWSSNDSRIRFNGAATASVAGGASVNVSGFIMKSQGVTFTVFATDVCGNVSSQNYTVNIVDNVSPQPVCVEDHRVTLNSNGTVRVYANAFNNNRSSDNCGVERFHVRRMDKRNAVTTTETPCDYTTEATSASCTSADIRDYWNDYVDFDCGDAGRTDVMVAVRYIDAAGNFADCMVNVTVDDKTRPVCVAPQNITSTCTSPDLLNYGALFTTPAAYDNCGIASTTSADNRVLAIGCTASSVTRTWTFTDCAGNTTACSQTLTVNPVRGFRVTPLADQNEVCSGNITTAEQDRLALVARLKLLHEGSAGSQTAILAVTGSSFTTCAGPVVDVTESTYSNTEFCKVIVRTFVIKDICDFSTVRSSATNGNVYSTIGGDLQSVLDNDGRHYIVYTRTIRIKDNTAPTSVPPVVAPICVTSGPCTFGFSTTLTGTDGCAAATTGSSLFFSWRILNSLNVSVGSGTGAAVSATGLPFGTYTVYYRVADLCGNLSTEYTITVSGSDCKAPQILVHNKVVALAGATGTATTGMAELLYIDIRNNIFDNCDGDITDETSKIVLELVLPGEAASPVAPRTASTTRSVMFDCSHVGTQRVRVWARDNAGNWNFAISTITVQDNDGICSPRAMLLGAAATENNSPVKDVVIAANNNGVTMGSATSTAAGAFQVNNLTAGASYQVRAAKTIDTDKKNGVTTLDIALISKHNLGIEALGTAYKVIAADVNKDGEVDGTDMLHIRRFILSITPSLPAGSAWRFIDKSYTFRNPANPFGEDFPEVINLSNVPAGTTAANFTAVKLGDVNNSFDATQVRGSKALVFNANDMDVVAGNEYTVAINAANFNASAFQGTFAFEGATVKAVKAGNLNNTSDANFGMFNKAVTASWNGTSEASAEVVNITFVATKSGKLSEMLTVNSSVTMAEGYDAAGNAMNVTLKFNTGKVAGGEFALYQNTPNPVALSTTIGFNLPKDGQAKLTIYTAEGKVLSVINNTYKAGANQVTVNKADLNASGMLYYRLDTQDNSSTRKMIIIE